MAVEARARDPGLRDDLRDRCARCPSELASLSKRAIRRKDYIISVIERGLWIQRFDPGKGDLQVAKPYVASGWIWDSGAPAARWMTHHHGLHGLRCRDRNSTTKPSTALAAAAVWGVARVGDPSGSGGCGVSVDVAILRQGQRVNQCGNAVGVELGTGVAAQFVDSLVNVERTSART